MKNLSHTWQWALAYGVPAFLIGVPTMGLGLLMLPLGGTLGVVVGLTSEAPFFTVNFRILLIIECLFSLALFFIGMRYRRYFWGKVLSSVGIYLWCLSGLVGFGPQ